MASFFWTSFLNITMSKDKDLADKYLFSLMNNLVNLAMYADNAALIVRSTRAPAFHVSF